MLKNIPHFEIVSQPFITDILYVHCHNFFHLQKVQDGEGFSIGVDQWMLGNNRILNQ
jgi:hypothetical protein